MAGWNGNREICKNGTTAERNEDYISKNGFTRRWNGGQVIMSESQLLVRASQEGCHIRKKEGKYPP